MKRIGPKKRRNVVSGQGFLRFPSRISVLSFLSVFLAGSDTLKWDFYARVEPGVVPANLDFTCCDKVGCVRVL